MLECGCSAPGGEAPGFQIPLHLGPRQVGRFRGHRVATFLPASARCFFVFLIPQMRRSPSLSIGVAEEFVLFCFRGNCSTGSRRLEVSVRRGTGRLREAVLSWGTRVLNGPARFGETGDRTRLDVRHMRSGAGLERVGRNFTFRWRFDSCYGHTGEHLIGRCQEVTSAVEASTCRTMPGGDIGQRSEHLQEDPESSWPWAGARPPPPPPRPGLDILAPLPGPGVTVARGVGRPRGQRVLRLLLGDSGSPGCRGACRSQALSGFSPGSRRSPP